MTTTREAALEACPKNCGPDLVRFHAASATCHWVECDCGWTGPKRANKKRAAEVWNAARPAPQPVADTRVVGPQCCMCGKLDLSTVEDDGGTECELHDGRWVCSRDCYDRAIIGTAQSDKIAEAARDVQTHRMNWKHAMELVRGNCPLPNEDQDDRSYWDHQIRSLDVAADALRALAGKGDTP